MDFKDGLKVMLTLLSLVSLLAMACVAVDSKINSGKDAYIIVKLLNGNIIEGYGGYKNIMITKKTIQRQIEELEKKIQGYMECMNSMRDDADLAECYGDYTLVNLIASDLDQINGMINGLQIAIDQLKTLL